MHVTGEVRNMAVTIGAAVPRRGNAFSRWLGGFVLRVMGWRLEGAIPDEPKMVMIGAPHTSNMDGVMAIVTLTALGLRASTMIKDTAFKGVMGPLLRWFGAIPINRRSPKGVVEQSVDTFARSQQLILLIAAEGTRSAAKEWKRGFYHIAAGAKVPIVIAAVNYQRRLVTFGPAITPSGVYASDFARMMAFYGEHASPRHAERMSKPMCDALGVEWKPRDGDK
jgi:1-acyl-sn-glycerol-3-phosphate acyltransferase